MHVRFCDVAAVQQLPHGTAQQVSSWHKHLAQRTHLKGPRTCEPSNTKSKTHIRGPTGKATFNGRDHCCRIRLAQEQRGGRVLRQAASA